MLRCYDYADMLGAGAFVGDPLLLLNTSHLYPPMYYLIGGAFILSFDNPFWIPPFLRVFYLAILVFSTYWIVLNRFANSRQALLTAILLALSPAVTMVSHGNLLDLPSLSLIAFSMASTCYFFKRATVPRFLLATLSVVTCLLMKHTSAVFILLFIGWFVVEAILNRQYRKAGALVAVGVSGVLSLSSWYAANWSDFVQFVSDNQLSGYSAIVLRSTGIRVQRLLPWLYSLGITLFPLLSLSLYMLYRKRWRKLSVVLLSIFLIGVFGLGTFYPLSVESQWQSALNSVFLYTHPYRIGQLSLLALVVGLCLAGSREHKSIAPFAFCGLCGTLVLAILTASWVPHPRYSIALVIPVFLYVGLAVEGLLSGRKFERAAAVTFLLLICLTYTVSNFSPYPLTVPEGVRGWVDGATSLARTDSPSPECPDPDFDWGQSEVMKLVESNKQLPPRLLVCADVSRCSTTTFLFLKRTLELERAQVEPFLIWNTKGYSVKDESCYGDYGWFLLKDGEVISGFYQYTPELKSGLDKLKDWIGSNCELVFEKRFSKDQRVYLYRRKSLDRSL